MTYTNNATRLLASRNIVYQVHVYDYESGVHLAVEVAVAIGLPEDRVFKTLVTLPDTPNAKPTLAVIPAQKSLDLKLLARAIGVKKARMASHAQAEDLTGLQTGGISPLALVNKGFKVLVDSSAIETTTIAVSAGQRGANIELAPKDLIAVTGARLAVLCDWE